MSEVNKKQAVKVLIATVIFQLFLGMIYVWSVFVLPVSEAYAWDVEAVKLTASFKIGFFVLGMFVGGKLLTKMCVSKVTMLGGFILTAGLVLAAVTPVSTPWLLYITYGIVCGFGSGVGYTACIIIPPKWFPKKRGLATGVCVGAFGLSVSVFAPIIEALLRNFTIQHTFLILAAMFGAATLVFARMIKAPEVTAASTAASSNGVKDLTTGQMFRRKECYMILFSLWFLHAAFFVINPAFQTLAVDRGFSASFGAALLVISGVANTGGRIIIPGISDKLGNELTILVLMIVMALASFVVSFATGPLFVVAVAVVPMSFGASLSIFPLIVADYFGTKNVGANYGAVMIGFAMSALFMPGLIGLLGGYTIRFIAVGILSLVGMFAIGPMVIGARKKNA